MFGIDISGWQRGIDLTRENFDFCIIKATEGVGYTADTFEKFAVQLTKLNKLIGCYHFARPDNHGTEKDMQEEADWFCKEVKRIGLMGKAILVLDWEREPMDRPDLIKAWLRRVEDNTGIVPFLYGSSSKLSTQTFKPLQANWPIWMARWPSKQKIYVKDVDGWLKTHMALKTQIDWKIWQFSSTGQWSGFNGNVDFDFSDMTREDWEFFARGKYNDTDSAKPEAITEDMQWAIDAGLFAGYGDGRYGPKDPLTREQAATLFRRYTEKFIK